MMTKWGKGLGKRMWLSRDTCEVGRNDQLCKHSLGSAAKKRDERVVVDCRVNMNQQCHVVVQNLDVLVWI